MQEWLISAERYWKSIRGSKANQVNIYGWLDYNKKLTNQNPRSQIVVLYNGAGRGNMNCCILHLEHPILISLDATRISTNGFIAEHDTFWYGTWNEEESYYLSAVINSSSSFSLLHTIKSPRHIQKKVWELPIPDITMVT